LLKTDFRNMIMAGRDTTANMLSWILWELSKHTHSQTQLREEILIARAKKTGDAAFNSSDYDSMPFLNAVIKEGLRLHPIIPNLMRKAGKDDVIPLLEPITTKDGRVIEDIAVSKGQTLMCCVAAYNRCVP
jgi:cytochrome P450